jgi:formyltetrahydrofolate deformylase
MTSLSAEQPIPNPAEHADEVVLSLCCPDRPGLIFDISRLLNEQRCDIVESQQFSDRAAESFYLRAQFRSADGGPVNISALRDEIGTLAATSGMQWRLSNTAARPRLLIMVSKFGHCLNDLLFRANSGDLTVDVAAVVSNHPDFGTLADNYDVPFHHIPVAEATKPQAEDRLVELVEQLDIDLVGLARYMQILSADLCKHLEGRAINIHHSMLPSFKGARPYFQAHDRGVKLIGATAHYVTADLDEGPIIEQEIARVDHTMSAEGVTKLGRDNECLALARAVRWHSENRILLDGHRTVVFR